MTPDSVSCFIVAAPVSPTQPWGLSLFSCVVADEVQGERGAQCIKARCADYLDRAEQLKEYLSKKGKSPPAKPIKESQSDDKG